MKSNNLKAMRKAANLTQEELATMIGVKRSVISKYETGSIEPSVSQLEHIAEKLSECPGFRPIKWYELCSDSIEGQTIALAEETVKRVLEFGQKAYPNTTGSLEGVVSNRIKDSTKEESTDMTSDLECLIDYYSRLNDTGKRVALDRVQELTEIPKYQRPTGITDSDKGLG